METDRQTQRRTSQAKPPSRRKRRRLRPFWRGVRALVIVALAIGLIWALFFRGAPPEELSAPVPDWVELALLPPNPYSRPETPLTEITGVVVHYTGNPGTTARQNNSYFRGLAKSEETWASSHFLVGLDGEVLLNVPLDEVAYCSSQRNNDTISIECCHPDEAGEFTADTYTSLTQLVQWVCDTYKLSRDQVIRHYDVTGKECPRYYVQHPDAWESFLDTVDYSTAE